MNDKYIELAKKLKALSEQGEGGEKYNAQLIRFQIVASGDVAVVTRAKPVKWVPEPEPGPEPVASSKRKGGRLKKAG